MYALYSVCSFSFLAIMSKNVQEAVIAHCLSTVLKDANASGHTHTHTHTHTLTHTHTHFWESLLHLKDFLIVIF